METTDTKPLSDRLREAAAAIRGDIADQQLDPGIADVVVMLRNLGFEPTDSGDGVSKPDDQRDFDVKHVACSVDQIKMVSEAERLHQVLGWGWKVEASYDPSAGGSCIILATKNEAPGPRHAAALSGFPFELRGRLGQLTPDEDRLVFNAGCALHAALTHELGRR